VSEFVETAIRAFAVPTASSPNSPRPQRGIPRPDLLLVLDTETTLDQAQRLTFGNAKLFQKRPHLSGHDPADWELLDDVLFHSDDASAEEIEVLRDYAKARGTSTSLLLNTRVLSRQDFVDRMIWDWGYKARALVVGFNLPFDLSRLSVNWGAARGRYAGGLSLDLFEYGAGKHRKSNRYRPRITVKTIDSKRQFISFGSALKLDAVDRIPEGSVDGKSSKNYVFHGHFLDLRTLAFALTNSSHSLRSACRDFGVEQGKLDYAPSGRISPKEIEYCRRDVDATFELACRLFAEFDAHPISPDFHAGRTSRHRERTRAGTVQITKAFSPARIAKGYLRAMGITPFLERSDISSGALGFATAAFYGGRAECRLRQLVVPVVYVDYLSMYPTVNALMDLARFMRAERVTVEECTDEIQEFLDSLRLEDCFNPALWPRFVAFAEIQPDGEHLPVRARYGDGSRDWQIGVNPFRSDHPHWYALPDLVSSKLRTGHAPRIRRAFRLEATGTASGLCPVKLRGAIAVDPSKDDLFRAAIEERNRMPDKNSKDGQFLKVFSNSGSYGIFGEWNRQELSSGQHAEVDVFGPLGQFRTRVNAPESMGEYCFPPIAAVITSAARLMLMLLEASVRELGGTYAMCDTDSMAIVATEHGGLIPCPGGEHTMPDGSPAIRALSSAEVDEIQGRFAQLNPYDRAVVPGSILKVEDENFATDGSSVRKPLYIFAISAKRYALFNLDAAGEPVIRKYSEHGLGHLLNPTNPASDDREWIRQTWEMLVRESLRLPVTEPAWLDQPALSRITGSSPFLLKPFEAYNHGKSYADQVKPFNFLLSAHVAPFGHPTGADATKFHLIAPYTKDSRQWRKLRWTDIHSRGRYGITTTGHPSPTRVRVQSYRDVLSAYRKHPEPKSNAPGGGPCDRDSMGLLGFRPVRSLARPVLVGKESNRIEDVQGGLVHDADEVYTEYGDRERDEWDEVFLPVLKLMQRDEMAREAGLSARQVSSIRQGHAMPRPAHRAALERVAGEFARQALGTEGQHLTVHQACAKFAVAHTPQMVMCASCGIEFWPRSPRARYCSGGCRQRAHRARRISGTQATRRGVRFVEYEASRIAELNVTEAGTH